MSEAIKLKIAALLAKAESTTNQFEADAFMAKVNELLEKHQMEMHEVRSARKNANDPMGKEKGETNLYASMLWARDLGGALARYYGCKFLFWKERNNFTYEVVGRESARVTFELMFPFIITQVKLQAKRLDGETGNAKSRSVIERQVGQALMIRVDRLASANAKHRIVLTGKGLIPVDDLEAATAAFYPKIKIMKNKPITLDRDAMTAADKIGLHHQATGRGPTKLLS